MVIDVEIQSIVYTSTLGNCGVITRIKYSKSVRLLHIHISIDLTFSLFSVCPRKVSCQRVTKSTSLPLTRKNVHDGEYADAAQCRRLHCATAQCRSAQPGRGVTVGVSFVAHSSAHYAGRTNRCLLQLRAQQFRGHGVHRLCSRFWLNKVSPQLEVNCHSNTAVAECSHLFSDEDLWRRSHRKFLG